VQQEPMTNVGPNVSEQEATVTNVGYPNVSEQPVAEELSREQLERLIGDVHYEMGRLTFIRQTASLRAERYENRTNRVKFLKNDIEKIQRDLRRFDVAKRTIDQCSNALNSLTLELEQHQRKLASL